MSAPLGNHDDIGARIMAAVGEAGARELLDALTRPEADRAALIGRLVQRNDAAWLAELLTDLGGSMPSLRQRHRSRGGSVARRNHR